MSILIKGMEMPQNCFLCKLSYMSGERLFCSAMKNEEVLRSKIDSNCPLIELPPHGRLIDADALVKDLKRQCEEVFKIDAVSPDDFWIKRDKAYNERLWKTWCESFFEYLKARETIIEAEGRE